MTVSQEAAPFEIPTIDISPYLADNHSTVAAEVVRRVRQACMTTGFFSLTGHGISRELQGRVFDAARTFFALPLDEKRAVVAPPLKNRGYELIGGQALQEGAAPDLKEGFYVSQHIPNDSQKAKDHPYFMGENVFPASLPPEAMKTPLEAYYAEIFNLSCKVLEILAKGLPHGDGVFDEFVANDPLCGLRILHYPPQKNQDEKALGAGAHTDFGAITLLLQDSAGGLEVLNNATQEWVAVPPDPDAYVVNIGDMLDFWTKGAYHSNVHRVINTSGRDRYSVPFFFDGNLDVRLAPLDGTDPLHGVLTVEEHMLERFGTTYGRAAKAAAEKA